MYKTRVANMTHYFPSASFLCGSTCYHDISFSLVSPAQRDYAKYNQNRCTVLIQIVLWTVEYRHTFLDQNLDLKWNKEIFIKSLDSYLDH